jgi:hypothetical protein
MITVKAVPLPVLAGLKPYAHSRRVLAVVADTHTRHLVPVLPRPDQRHRRSVTFRVQHLVADQLFGIRGSQDKNIVEPQLKMRMRLERRTAVWCFSLWPPTGPGWRSSAPSAPRPAPGRPRGLVQCSFKYYL